MRFELEPGMVTNALAYYAQRPADFINHWVDTFDPRNAMAKLPTRLPLVMFERQGQLVEFLLACLREESNGLVDKSRDMGATWVAGGFSVWLWRFWPGASIGWGSRKEQLVDKLGDPDSIFEKMRMVIKGLPRAFWPRGFDPSSHMTYMRIINPENEATITGEAGDNIGRGGRKSIYFKDEAQPLDAKILTPSGWKTMADMAVGERVIGRDGKPTSVIGINDCGAHDVYRVVFSDGTSARCSESHLWAVNKVWGRKEALTLRTAEIAERVSYKSPRGVIQYLYRVPLCEPVEFDQDSPHPLHPYLVGALLGDGSVGSVPHHSPNITTIDAEIVEQFRALLPNGCTITQDGERISWRLGDAAGRRGKKHKSRARQAILAAGIAGMRSGDKRVPTQYLLASTSDRLALLQGLMDTDGSAANGGAASFHTSSAGLAEDVRFLTESLGGTATLNVKKDKRGYKDQHVLHLALPPSTKPFRLTRKLAAYTVRRHPMGRTIVSVEKCARESVRCISVEAPDGLYLTDDLIVTHNSAHYERPESIEAALMENTRVQIDISTVNGVGNVFDRKRQAGIEWVPGRTDYPQGQTRVFVLDWRDHPLKTEEWHRNRERDARANGLLHLFRQEVDRDAAASLSGIIIKPEWINAAVDAHIELGFGDIGGWSGGFDPYDEGGDLHALSFRKGVVLEYAEDWGDGDTGDATRQVIKQTLGRAPVAIQYDCIGIGAGVKAEANRLKADKKLPQGVDFLPWDAGSAVVRPKERVVPGDQNSPTNEDFYYNLKAQGWWSLARRFEKVYRMKVEGIKYPSAELISLSSKLPKLHQIKRELSQPVMKKSGDLRLVVDKAPAGTRSPNIADSIMMNYFPVKLPMVIDPKAVVLSAMGGMRR